MTKKSKAKSATTIGAKKRSIIVSSALKIFSENGYNGASIQKIADAASLPKANVLYYFDNKQRLYSEVMQSIIAMWNSSFDAATVDDCPAEVLASYICEKMEISRLHPLSSKVFAIEIINGAKNLDEHFRRNHVQWVEGRIQVIKGWVCAGKMDPVEPEYLLYHIWASTQHYADFSAQIAQIRGRMMSKQAFKDATNTVVKIILQGCGLTVPSSYLLSAHKL